jgi:hypothetical protein
MSHFTVEHKGKNYRCNKQTYEGNPKKSYKEHGVVKCVDDNLATRKERDNPNACSSIVYHHDDCDYITPQYHRISQVYYSKLHYICELLPGHKSVWKKYSNEEYSDDSLNDFISDLTDIISKNDIGLLYNAKTDKGENAKKWKDLCICCENLSDEILLRKKFRDECTCIRDKKHNHRISLCETLLAKLQAIKQQFLQYDCPETRVTLPNKLHMHLVPSLLSPEDLIKTFNLGIKFDYMDPSIQVVVHKTVTFVLNYITNLYKELLPWPPIGDSLETLKTMLQRELGDFETLNQAYVLEVCREFVFKRLQYIFEDFLMYYQNGISCITYDQMKPSGIRIDYEKLKEALEQNHGISIPVDVLEDYVNTHVHDPSYKACLQSWYDNKVQVIIDLCIAIKHNPNLGELSRRKIAQTFCNIEAIRDAFKDIIAKDSAGYANVWSGKNMRGLKQVLEDGSKPTYRLAKDMSKMTMITMSNLLWMYENTKDRFVENTEDEGSEDDERPSKRPRNVQVILFK